MLVLSAAARVRVCQHCHALKAESCAAIPAKHLMALRALLSLFAQILLRDAHLTLWALPGPG